MTGIASSLASSLNSIWTAKVLPVVEGSAWRLTYCNNLNSLLLLLPAVLTEAPDLLSSPHLLSPGFWTSLLVSGVLGLAMGYASTLQIQVTSPLTHNVSGTSKAAFQTVLAVFWFHETGKPFTWWLSNLVVLSGSLAYAYVRHVEAELSRAQQMSVKGLQNV